MTIKYVVCPGFVISKNDGQSRLISFQQLVRLYKINPAECVEYPLRDFGCQNTIDKRYPSLQRLYPNYDGDYSLPPIKSFRMHHRFFRSAPVQEFTEETAPSWLKFGGFPGSTMDNRWFWNDHVMKLEVGQSIKTDFQEITRTQ